MPATVLRSEKLDLRLSAVAKQALTAAARAERRSVSDFVLDSALARAQETLTQRDRFSLDAKQWQAFWQALDAEPRDLPAVTQLFASPSVFEGAALK